jgi:hypothetical protein
MDKEVLISILLLVLFGVAMSHFLDAVFHLLHMAVTHWKN